MAGRGVDTVVVTHSHFDHADNLDLYPDARIIISREAMELKMTRGPEPVIERLRGKNVQIVEEEVMIENTFRFKVIGSHERGSCVIYFSSCGRDYVLTGDESYTCANALENRPIGSVFCDAAKNTAFTADSYSRGLIPLPCHDAAVFDKYPLISDNIVRIV